MTHCFRLSNVPNGATLRLIPTRKILLNPKDSDSFNKELYISSVTTSDHHFVFKVSPFLSHKLSQYKKGYNTINLNIQSGGEGEITDIQMPPMVETFASVQEVEDLLSGLDKYVNNYKSTILMQDLDKQPKMIENIKMLDEIIEGMIKSPPSKSDMPFIENAINKIKDYLDLLSLEQHTETFLKKFK